MAEEENKPKRYRRTNVDIQADIIKAAESLIKKKGFASMLVTELIKKARIEPLVFYNRYDNLREFYDEFVKRYDYWFKDVLTGVQFPTDSELGYISIFKDVQKALQDKVYRLQNEINEEHKEPSEDRPHDCKPHERSVNRWKRCSNYIHDCEDILRTLSTTPKSLH